MSVLGRKAAGVMEAVVLLLATACQSNPTRVFTLTPVVSASIANHYSGRPIRIDAVHIPPALDRIEILSQVAPGELRVNELDHWAAPLGPLIRQALTADLIARLPPGALIFPQLRKPAGAIGVTVDLLAFSVDRRGATLEVSWVGAAAGTEAPACGGTMVLQTTPAGEGPAAIADALSTLLAQLADRMAAELLRLAPIEPGS
jgi:uncharacterized lipoprotein YmbA